MATDNGMATAVLTVNYTDLTVDTTDGTQTINFASALPAGAIPLAAQVNIATPFAGQAAPTVDIGLSGGHHIAQAFDSTQAAGKYVVGAPASGAYDGGQLSAKFTPASGKKLKSNSSAGKLTITVWHIDPS